MGFLSPLSNLGLGVLGFFLFFQFLWLALTLSPDDERLQWASREDLCTMNSTSSGATQDTYTTQFFSQRLCQVVDDVRTCEDYGKVEETTFKRVFYSNSEIEAAESDFGDAGNLSAASLTFTLVQVVMVLISCLCGTKIAFCNTEHLVFKALYLGLSGLMVLFSIGAAGVAGDSAALDKDVPDCDQEEKNVGYGIGVHAFLVFWLLMQIILVLIPCGPLAREKTEALAGASEAPEPTA